MVPEYAFDKAKLPRNYSYPLKRSVLDAMLASAVVSKIQCVYYWLRQSGSNVMRADFCGEGRRGWASAGLSSITVYAVPSSERQMVEAALVNEVLPQMMQWLQQLERAGNTRRAVDQRFNAACLNGVVTVESS